MDEVTQSVQLELQKFLSRLSPVEPEDLLAEDLNMDSLDVIAAIQQLELKFKIAVSESDLENLQSVADLIRLVKKYHQS